MAYIPPMDRRDDNNPDGYKGQGKPKPKYIAPLQRRETEEKKAVASTVKSKPLPKKEEAPKKTPAPEIPKEMPILKSRPVDKPNKTAGEQALEKAMNDNFSNVLPFIKRQAGNTKNAVMSGIGQTDLG